MRPDYSERALERAGNAIAAVLGECCTVGECESTLAEIHPDDWKRAARLAIEEAEEQRLIEARRAAEHAAELPSRLAKHANDYARESAAALRRAGP